jgi:hypothetical protein
MIWRLFGRREQGTGLSPFFERGVEVEKESLDPAVRGRYIQAAAEFMICPRSDKFNAP